MSLFLRQIAKCGQSVTVKKRTLQGSGFDTSQPTQVFTDIASPNAIIKTIESVRGGNKMFSGIQIVDSATHVFCVAHSAALDVVERDNYFIVFGGHNFRVLAVTNINERDKAIAIQCVDRGTTAKEATEI